MKKITAILLAVMMLLSVLSGCGGGDDKDKVGGTISGDDSSPSDAAPDADDNGGADDDDEGDADDDDAENDEGAAAEDLSLGEISGGAKYVNDFAGISFTLPEGWDFATDEELAELMDISLDTVGGDLDDAVMQYAIDSTVYDMMAYSELGENVMILFENLGRYLGGSKMTEDEYIETLQEGLPATGLDYTSYGTSEATICGKTYTLLELGVEDYGMYQDYLIRKEGKYMISIAVTGFYENPSADLGEYFK